MTDSKKFFAEPQAAAILKHGILKRYLPVFVTATGSTRGEVSYLDCYAGPGEYENGALASPALAIEVAQSIQQMRGKATLRGHLVEVKKELFERLEAMLAERGVDWSAKRGKASELVEQIVTNDIDDRSPLFAFIDPFGLPIPMAHIHLTMDRAGRLTHQGRSASTAATEILLNFSRPGIERIGGELTANVVDPSRERSRQTNVANMDLAMGGDWWHEIWISDGDDRFDQIREGYVARLLEGRGSWKALVVPVSDRWNGPPSYHLIFLTQHPKGAWAYHEAVSGAMEEYRTYCHEHESMFELDPLKDREERWVETILANIEDLLRERASFVMWQQMRGVYGSTLGMARQKHVNKAMHILFKGGSTSTDPTGQSSTFHELVVHRGLALGGY